MPHVHQGVALGDGEVLGTQLAQPLQILGEQEGRAWHVRGEPHTGVLEPDRLHVGGGQRLLGGTDS